MSSPDQFFRLKGDFAETKRPESSENYNSERKFIFKHKFIELKEPSPKIKTVPVIPQLETKYKNL